MDLQAAVEQMPFYGHLNDEEKRLIGNSVNVRHYRKGDVLHSHLSECLGLIQLQSGSVRVTMQSAEGREITIYTLQEGDRDVLSASCVINQITFDTMMIADTDTDVLVIPAPVVGILDHSNIYVHSDLMELSALRFSDAMWTMQQILFLRMDQRVAVFLLDEYSRTDNPEIAATQDRIARSISSAREVTSRVLGRMEKDGLIETRRGTIRLLDIDALEALLG